MTCLPPMVLTTMSCRNDSLLPFTGSTASLGPVAGLPSMTAAPLFRSYSATSFGARGSVMSRMSMSADSSLSTIAA